MTATDPWAPDPIPAALPPKPYTLPAVGTDPWPGRRDPDDDLDSFSARFERRHGPATVLLQRHRAEAWDRIVTAYQTAPHRFPAAWNYLNEHPIFYRFRYAPDGEGDPAQITQERHLAHDIGLYELYFKVSAWCAQRCDDDECGHPSRDICWAETGPWAWPPSTPGELLEYAEAPSSHDYRLDVYGDTYESCILQLAYKVWTLYGNDRALDGAANKFDEKED